MTNPARQRGLYGRLPHDPYRPAIRLARSLTGVVPEHPAAVDYLARLAGGWKMLGNDVMGNCVAVTWASIRRTVTAILATEVYPAQYQVDAVYATQNPRGADNGMVIQLLLEYLTKTAGPDGVKALGFAKVDHTNLEEVKAAIAIFGFVWTGLTVQAANETQFAQGRPWDYVSGSPDVGGHSVETAGYGPGVTGPLAGDAKFETWAEETSFTDAFWLRKVDEAWVVIWPEHLESKAFLEGVDLAAFAADYTALTGKPFPVPVPAPPVPVPTPVPVPVPPAPGTPDEAFFTDTIAWAAARHTGSNKAAAASRNTWAKAKGLM